MVYKPWDYDGQPVYRTESVEAVVNTTKEGRTSVLFHEFLKLKRRTCSLVWCGCSLGSEHCCSLFLVHVPLPDGNSSSNFRVYPTTPPQHDALTVFCAYLSLAGQLSSSS
eukprot:6105574-Amphidinium_carterae.1